MIKSAELLVDYDKKEKKLLILTNESLISSRQIETYQKTSKLKKHFNESYSNARLQSPSLVLKVSLADLQANKPIDSKELKSISMLEKFTLVSGPEQMIFFRTESYQFPFVEVKTAANMKGITFRLYGTNERAPIALYFSLDNNL